MMQHSEQLCECGKDQQQLLYRYSLAELDDLQLQLQTECPESSIDASCELKGKPKKGCKQLNAVGLVKKVRYVCVYI